MNKLKLSKLLAAVDIFYKKADEIKKEPQAEVVTNPGGPFKRPDAPVELPENLDTGYKIPGFIPNLNKLFPSNPVTSPTTPVAKPSAPAAKPQPGYEGRIDPRVQQALVNMGKNLGTTGPGKNGVDGALGGKTRAALNEFKAGTPHTQAMSDKELQQYIIQYYK